MIKLIDRPSIYVVGTQSLSHAGIAEFMANHTSKTSDPDAPRDDAGDALVEMAGRLCYMSYDKPRPGGRKKYIKHILECGHGSVLEHAVVNVIATGISRSLSHQLIRHRVGISPSQLSQRYVDESDCEFVIPPLMVPMYEDWKKANQLADDGVPSLPVCPEYTGYLTFYAWMSRLSVLQNYYVELAAQLQGELCRKHAIPTDKPIPTDIVKQARETARSVLPSCTETKMFLTINGRAIRHILKMRGSVHADQEIRRFAVALLEAVKPYFSDILQDASVLDGCVSLEYGSV